MPKNINRERLYGDIEKLKEDHVRDGSHAKLTREERRQERIKNHYSREHYRRYGRDNEITYASVVFRETAIAAFAAALYGLILIMAALSLIAIMAAANQSPVLAVIIALAAFYFLLWPHLRRMVKRLRFVKQLRRSCESGKMRLHVYRSPLKSLYRAGGVPDFAVECGDTVYECMFYPRLRRLTVLRFEKPGEVAVVTGILKSRIS